MYETPPAGWYADPLGRHEHRYWDGTQWTEHVGSRGHQAVDPLNGNDRPQAGGSAEESERHGHYVGAAAVHSDGQTLWSEQVLIINQKAKLIGSTLTYGVFSQTGQQVGTIQELRRDLSTVVRDRLRLRTDATRARRYQVVDTQDRVLLAMTRPEIGWFAMKGKLVIEGPGGNPIGQIAHESYGLGGSIATAAQAGVNSASAIVQLGLGGLTGMVAGSAMAKAQQRLDSAVEGLDKVGHARFGLEADGRRLGSIQAESVKEWDFKVQDPGGIEFARITKTWAGWAKERFTKADNYVIEMHHPLEEPLRSLLIAGALAIDVELKERGEQTRGSSLWGTRSYK